MRERRIFAERAKVLKSDEAVKKYFLVYEGSDTEAIYFDAVQSMRDDIRINPLIQLIPLIRSYSEEGWSNPKKILDRLILNLRESQEQYVSYESLLNRIMDYLLESKAITTSKLMAKNIWQTMTNICGNKLGKELDDVVDNIQETSKMLLGYLAEEYEVVNIVADISEIIKNGDLTYDQDFDQHHRKQRVGHTAHHGVAAGKVAVAEDGGMKALEGVNRLLEHLHHRDAPDILRGLGGNALSCPLVFLKELHASPGHHAHQADKPDDHGDQAGKPHAPVKDEEQSHRQYRRYDPAHRVGDGMGKERFCQIGRAHV